MNILFLYSKRRRQSRIIKEKQAGENNMTLQEYKKKKMKDPKFKKAYEEVQSEMKEVRTKVDKQTKHE